MALQRFFWHLPALDELKYRSLQACLVLPPDMQRLLETGALDSIAASLKVTQSQAWNPRGRLFLVLHSEWLKRWSSMTHRVVFVSATYIDQAGAIQRAHI